MVYTQAQAREDIDTADEREARKPRRERGTGPEYLSTLKHLQRLGLPKFTSKKDLKMVESWYSDIKQLLEGLRFSLEEMVTLTTFTLRDHAYTW